MKNRMNPGIRPAQSGETVAGHLRLILPTSRPVRNRRDGLDPQEATSLRQDPVEQRLFRICQQASRKIPDFSGCAFPGDAHYGRARHRIPPDKTQSEQCFPPLRKIRVIECYGLQFFDA
jgi:hypothetical protein